MHYKIWLYGTPFSGKSYFADTCPNAYVINTDGNLQFYKNSKGTQVKNYDEFVKALEEFDSDKYDTLVIDVLDHVYDMCREAFLQSNDIEHESDYTTKGGAETYGKGWTLLREQFWYMISKVRNIPANIVLISHDNEKEVKGKLGTSRTVCQPATIPNAIVSKMCGIFHFVGRCYRENDIRKISFETDITSPYNGYRLPIKDLIIGNTYEDFQNNIEK